MWSTQMLSKQQLIDTIYYDYETPIGKIIIACLNSAIIAVALKEKSSSFSEGQGLYKATTLSNQAARQLNEYFKGKRQKFDLPLAPIGTSFQQKVWKALQRISYGETKSYKQIAEGIGNPLASRAVGMANHNNPIMIIVPCHRVIGSSGKLVGYAGGLSLKQYLLDLENEKTVCGTTK